MLSCPIRSAGKAISLNFSKNFLVFFKTLDKILTLGRISKLLLSLNRIFRGDGREVRKY